MNGVPTPPCHIDAGLQDHLNISELCAHDEKSAKALRAMQSCAIETNGIIALEDAQFVTGGFRPTRYDPPLWPCVFQNA